MLKKFSQEKYEEGQKQEYVDRKQESGEDTKEYYTDNKRLWIQAYAPSKRSLVWLQGWNAHGTVWSRVEGNMAVLCPKELKTENEIKAVPDRQLSRDIKEITTTHDSFDCRKQKESWWDVGNRKNTHGSKYNDKNNCVRA